MANAPRLVMEGYEVLSHVQAELGNAEVLLGAEGTCRYCGQNRTSKFRQHCHSLPEGLGNKWLISVDECDDCNRRFSKFDDALCKSVGTLLTVGGVKGKKGKVRQTGASDGGHYFRHYDDAGSRRISVSIAVGDQSLHSAIGTSLGFSGDNILLKAVTPTERFVPRNAYKALVKSALAVLPKSELGDFSKLCKWVCADNDELQFSHLEVAFCLGNVGNPPPVSSITLLRRKVSNLQSFYTIAVICVGSFCWAIDLMPDELDNHLPPIFIGRINLRWSVVLAANQNTSLTIDYGNPIHLDWSSNSLQRTPIKAVQTIFNQRTLKTEVIPIFH